MAGQSKALEDLFLENLKDIYYTEKKILLALPKMAKAINSDELRASGRPLIQVFKLLEAP